MKIPSFLPAIFLVLVLASCSQSPVVITRDQALDFLYSNMPLPDSLTYPADFWEANVDKTLEVRQKMEWNVPEREFLHFVLPLRVNNENLDDFRTVYADELCQRVAGMSMYDAVLEINHWCREMATYAPSDVRTSSPLATIRKGLGRCGEESVLGVAALRAAGIPARQVYTPRWAHTDDNHAWIEAYVDGKWYFLGACEPEPKLNMAWFNGPVSRALLLHTKAFGDYDGAEDVISSTSAYTEINVTGNYVPVRNSVVKVVDTLGCVVGAASVEFKIYNYAEFYTVATYETDPSGVASLHTGIGDMLAWASKDDSFGLSKISSDTTVVVLNHKVGDVFGADFDIVPPAENPIPSAATDDEIFLNNERLRQEDLIREARPKGNAAVTDGFLRDNADNPNAAALLASLSEKDMNDVSREVLDDALGHCGDYFIPYRDCPRIENEFLYPYFSELGSGLTFLNPSEIVLWVRDNIRIDDLSNPQTLRIPPLSVWRSRCSDSFSRRIFFVALCRAKGFQARIDSVTGKTQYMQYGVWMDVDFGDGRVERRPQGWLTAVYEPVPEIRDPLYYTHFTMAKIEDGHAGLLAYDDNGFPSYRQIFAVYMPIDTGYYMMTSGRRMSDGSVMAHVEFFKVRPYNVTSVPLVLRSDSERISVKGTMDVSPFLSAAGRGCFILAVTGEWDEPSNHAVRELSSISDDLNGWGGAVIVYGGPKPEGIRHLRDGDSVASFGGDSPSQVLSMLAKGCGSSSRRLPVVAVCDSFGRIVYFSQGYNTSLAEDLRSITGRL